MEPESANQQPGWGHDQSEGPSQCDLTRMLISEMELSQDCGYSAVLWWRRFFNIWKYLHTLLSVHWFTRSRPCQAMSGLIRMYLWMADKKQDKCPSPGAPRVQSPEAWLSVEFSLQRRGTHQRLSPVQCRYFMIITSPLLCKEITFVKRLNVPSNFDRNRNIINDNE